MSKIWVLSELYYPELTSTGYFLTKISEALALDFNVNVITRPATVDLNSVESVSYEIINNVNIYRGLGTTFKKKYLIGRLINIVVNTLSIFIQALYRCNRSDKILVVTNPPILPFAALLLKFIKGCDFILLVHDVYPEVLIATGYLSSKSFLNRLLLKLNKSLYYHASRIITLGRDMSELVGFKLPASHHDKVVCIPNWADLEIVHPVLRKENELLRKLNLENKFVILYAGNLGKTHDIGTLAEAAKVFSDNKEDIHFLIIGEGSQKTSLEKFVKDSKIENITTLPFLPNSEKTTSLTACDVAIISFKAGMAGISVPSRMYNQMAAGKAIIAITDDHSELARVITEEKIGWVIPPKDLESLLKAVRDIKDNFDQYTKMGEHASKMVRKTYSYERISDSYRKLFRNITQSNHIIR